MSGGAGVAVTLIDHSDPSSQTVLTCAGFPTLQRLDDTLHILP